MNSLQKKALLFTATIALVTFGSSYCSFQKAQAQEQQSKQQNICFLNGDTGMLLPPGKKQPPFCDRNNLP